MGLLLCTENRNCIHSFESLLGPKTFFKYSYLKKTFFRLPSNFTFPYLRVFSQFGCVSGHPIRITIKNAN